MSDQMAKDHARDYRLKNNLTDARYSIMGFADLDGLWPTTHAALQEVIGLLSQQEDQIVRRWD